jgi:polyribonucleotide nucleotidyltransferase
MEAALQKARTARLEILDQMDRIISIPRPSLSQYAPRIISLKVPRDKIGDIIGPGGKVIRSIIEETGAKIDVEDDGTVVIASVGQEGGERAFEIIQKIIEEPEVGKLYHGKVKNVQAFGAFIEILPKVEGLCHISELDFHRVRRVEDVVREGDRVWVKLIGIDNQNRLKLSRRAALEETADRRGESGSQGDAPTEEERQRRNEGPQRSETQMRNDRPPRREQRPHHDRPSRNRRSKKRRTDEKR